MESFPQKKEEKLVQKLKELNYEAALTAHGGEILELGTEEAPAIDPTLEAGLPTDLQKNLQLTALFAADFLKGPILLDKFGDDEIDPWERRNWRKDLISEYGTSMENLLELNRMKPNRMMPFLSQAGRLKDKLAAFDQPTLRTQQLLVRLTDMLQPFQPEEAFGSAYIHMPLQKRIENVRHLSNSAREFLALVTTHSKEQQAA